MSLWNRWPTQEQQHMQDLYTELAALRERFTLLRGHL